MEYTKEDVLEFIEEDDIKFIRLMFCDVFGNQKNMSILSYELRKAFKYGIAFDAFSALGFLQEEYEDLFLYPDASTFSILPWRPDTGKVARMYCSIRHANGEEFVGDTRSILEKAMTKARKLGIEFYFGTEQEFYLFKTNENGENTYIPYDNAGYMDMAPYDKGENVRREICLTLEEMGIEPERSYHEAGPGQNEVDFKYNSPLYAADNIMTFHTVVKTIAGSNGLFASFLPKPLENQPGSGFHINIHLNKNNEDKLNYVIAGILKWIPDLTIILNPREDSYERFGQKKAPQYISWSKNNRSSLIRLQKSNNGVIKAKLRSPDPTSNPYLAFALIIEAGLYGIENKLELSEECDIEAKNIIYNREKLPKNIKEAKKCGEKSMFLSNILPREIIDIYCKDTKNSDKNIEAFEEDNNKKDNFLKLDIGEQIQKCEEE